MQVIAQHCWGLIKYGSNHRKVNVNRVAQWDPPSEQLPHNIEITQYVLEALL